MRILEKILGICLIVGFIFLISGSLISSNSIIEIDHYADLSEFSNLDFDSGSNYKKELDRKLRNNGTLVMFLEDDINDVEVISLFNGLFQVVEATKYEYINFLGIKNIWFDPYYYQVSDGIDYALS